MRLHESFQLAVCKFYSNVPVWGELMGVWGWWVFRKTLLYGTSYYLLETLMGHRRRPDGSSPLRRIGVERWLPKTTDKELDESSRTLLEHLGYQELETQDKYGPLHVPEKSKFYSEIEYPISIAPLADDCPIPPVEGDTYPLGHWTLMNTLRILGNFQENHITYILKSSDIIRLNRGENLFNIGDVDHSFYIVISGSLSILIQEPDLSDFTKVKTVKKDEHIMSLFSVVATVLGLPSTTKPILVRAEEESVVLQVTLDSIRKYFWDDNRLDLEHFLIRSLKKIRSLYFEGLAEVAALNKQLLKPSMATSSYKPYEFNVNSKTQVDKMIKDAAYGIRKFIDLREEDFKDCSIGEFKGGTAVTRLGIHQKSIIYVHKGELTMVNESSLSKYQKMNKEFKDDKKFVQFSYEYNPMFYQRAGTIIGSWSMMTNSINYYTSMVPPGQNAIIVEIPERVVHRCWKRNPKSFFKIVERMINLWSSLARQIDHCLQWSFVIPGRVIYRRGDPDIATFLVVNGRLRYRVLTTRRMELESKSQFGYYEHGDWFGFVECAVSAKSMQKTVVADRYSEIVTLPKDLIGMLHKRFRHVTATMTNYLSLRIHKDYNYDEVVPLIYRNQKSIDSILQPKYSLSKHFICSSLAIFPLTKDIPAELYCAELCRHYPKNTLLLTHEMFKKHNNYEDWKENINRLAEWISPYSVKYVAEDLGMIIYLGNAGKVDLWNTFIARQSDYIQILGSMECSVDPYDIELMVEKEGWKSLKDFTFLHPAVITIDTDDQTLPAKLSSSRPCGSAMWLVKRPWLDTHHHTRFPECAFRYMKQQATLQEFEEYQNIVGINKHSDIARVARWLSDTMVGMVLGGGGAKGAAHLGVLEYMSQLDLPIDYVCGVSIGSFVGGLLALHQDLKKVEKDLRRLFHELEEPTRYLNDLTVPYSSLFRGRCMDEFVQNSFSDIRIEDLWVPYFCVTTDITGRHSRTHNHGLMWFYIRASMTLTMVFPPLVNPRDGHLLMDGGYSEILPGNHLRAHGVKYILASDIGDENGIPLFNIGYECSGIKCVLQNMFKINHWPSIPSRLDFMEQLNYIAARKYVQLMKKKDRRLVFIRPAVEFYTGKDFHKVDEIKMMAYYTTKRRIGIVRRGLSVHMMWTLLNTEMHDYHLLAAIDPRDKHTPMPIDDEMSGEEGNGEELNVPDTEADEKERYAMWDAPKFLL